MRAAAWQLTTMNIYTGLAVPLAFYNVPCQSFITQVQKAD
jgi:hypothetical protein